MTTSTRRPSPARRPAGPDAGRRRGRPRGDRAAARIRPAPSLDVTFVGDLAALLTAIQGEEVQVRPASSHGRGSPPPASEGGAPAPGTPATRDPGGTTAPSRTTAPAATRDPLPIRAPVSTTAPIPTRQPSSTTQPCRTARCPTEIVLPHDHVAVLVGMGDAAVLDVAPRSHRDRAAVGAQHAAVPHARLRPEMHARRPARPPERPRSRRRSSGTRAPSDSSTGARVTVPPPGRSRPAGTTCSPFRR